MIAPVQQTLLEKLTRICELSPDMRFGQLVATLEFVAGDFTDQSIWDVEDEILLAAFDKHLSDLIARSSTTQPALPPESDKAVAARPAMPMLNS